MSTVVCLFLSVAAVVIVYAWLGQGGAVSGLILFAGVLTAGIIRALSAPSSSS